MNFDFLSDLADELQRLLQEAELTVPTYEQLRLQDKRGEEPKRKIQHYDLSNLLIHFFPVYSQCTPSVLPVYSQCTPEEFQSLNGMFISQGNWKDEMKLMKSYENSKVAKISMDY